MSQIKLLHSGGNGVSIVAPDSNPASDRTLKLPSDGDGTILTTNSATGKILQVVQATKTDGFITNSTSMVDVPSLSASITPSNSSNKILITVSLGSFNNHHALKRAALNIVRGSTNVLVGDADTGVEVTAITCTRSTSGQGGHIQIPFSFTVLDSPSTTSATTYKVQVYSTDGDYVSVNRPGNQDAYSGNTASTLLLMEVAA